MNYGGLGRGKKVEGEKDKEEKVKEAGVYWIYFQRNQQNVITHDSVFLKHLQTFSWSNKSSENTYFYFPTNLISFILQK